MLPSESRLNEDRAGNSLHILSTVESHDAALEFISAMDVESDSSARSQEVARIPEEIQKALAALAAARPDSEHFLKIIQDQTAESERRVEGVIRRSQNESKADFARMLVVGGAALTALLGIAAVVTFAMMRRSQRREIAEVARREANALAVLPNSGVEAVINVSREQQERTKELQKLMESFSIAYQADRQRSTMVMETVAKKHGETLEQMLRLRQEIGENAGRAFLEMNRSAIDQIISEASHALTTRAAEVGLIAESASRKMEETASRLEVQNARAEALADELERTQREVDALFEKLRSAQESAEQAQSDASEQRRIAYEKTAELARKEAALAGLSLLMQEPVTSILENLADSPAVAAPGEGARSGDAAVRPQTAGEAQDERFGQVDSTDSGESSDRLPGYSFRITPAA